MELDTIAVRSARVFPHSEAAPAHVPAIDLSTTYGYKRADVVTASMDRWIDGESSADNSVYGRLHNPTVAGFERALAHLEGTTDAVAFSSGMAAMAAVLLSVASSDDRPTPHVVAVRPVYGGTDHLLSSGLLGSVVEWVSPEEVEMAIKPETGLVLLETPANPTLTMVDIRAVADAARRGSSRVGRRVPVAVDSTFATPVLQQPYRLGADLVVHSATKFLGGHGDVMGGAVASEECFARSLRKVRIVTGGVLHPMAGYLLHRGLQTLPVRVRAQQERAGEIARRLKAHPGVVEVLYPGLNGNPLEDRLLATQQAGAGSVLSFRVRGGSRMAESLVASLELITPAVSLGSVDSLVQIPAQLTHRVVPDADRASAGIPDDLIRVSVGLESVEDLWQDLQRALAVGRRSAA